MRQAPQQPASLAVPARIQSIAVLPLENLSGDPKQEYFADGMTEELIGALTKISSLRVISRTSAMQYKGAHRPLPEIARELGVDAVVEGSVARIERTQRVRVSAQLIEASNDRSLWSESYERQLGDVFALQDEVARNIAREIRAQLTPEDQQRLASARPVNSAAHEAYLRGRYHWARGTEEELREAKRNFEQAISIDPTYASAYAGLADYFWRSDEVPRAVATPKAKSLVLKALALDDTLPDAHTTLGSVRLYLDWDWRAADREFQKAIELSPGNAEAHRMYSIYLAQMGRTKEARREIEIAEQLDPVSVAAVATNGWVFYYARQYDHAIEKCNQGLKLDATAVSAHECLSSSYLGIGDHAKALAEARLIANGKDGDPLRLTALARAYAISGEVGEAKTILERLKGETKLRYVSPYFLGIIHAALGDKDGTFRNLRQAYLDRDSYLVRLKVDDAFDPVHSDPRYTELLRLMRLSE
jgi:TolB-like protein/Tfp pilus assembly protein PilF